MRRSLIGASLLHFSSPSRRLTTAFLYAYFGALRNQWDYVPFSRWGRGTYNFKGVSIIELTQITQEIFNASSRLSKGSKELFSLAKAFAEAERDYRQALAKEILLLKDAGKSATLIPDIARGNCAELKFKRDMTEFKYTAGRDALKAVEIQVSALQSILKYQSET